MVGERESGGAKPDERASGRDRKRVVFLMLFDGWVAQSAPLRLLSLAATPRSLTPGDVSVRSCNFAGSATSAGDGVQRQCTTKAITSGCLQTAAITRWVGGGRQLFRRPSSYRRQKTGCGSGIDSLFWDSVHPYGLVAVLLVLIRNTHTYTHTLTHTLNTSSTHLHTEFATSSVFVSKCSIHPCVPTNQDELFKNCPVSTVSTLVVVVIQFHFDFHPRPKQMNHVT